jgi:hypothetical protein
MRQRKFSQSDGLKGCAPAPGAMLAQEATTLRSSSAPTWRYSHADFARAARLPTYRIAYALLRRESKLGRCSHDELLWRLPSGRTLRRSDPASGDREINGSIELDYSRKRVGVSDEWH